uniref:Uncharacterized protein n=1 Tax=Rhizophora mucronata TaxID=61149 RepID=A0A2P2NXQ3_RHIMU
MSSHQSNSMGDKQMDFQLKGTWYRNYRIFIHLCWSVIK